jgi:ParB family chromosome partitioning protein
VSKHRGLGRGLSSLIPAGDDTAEDRSGLLTIPGASIRPNPRQPRSRMDDATLAELADSIREHGLIQPLIVHREADGHYTLIAGERRWRAAALAGLEEVPVVVKDASPQDMLELALIENIQRDDLNPVEEALAYQQLMADFGMTQEQVAQKVGKSRPAVANTVRLLNLPAAIQESVVEGAISGAHARALLPLDGQEVQITLMRAIIDLGLSVRQVEALVRVLSRLPGGEAQAAVVLTMVKHGYSVPQVEAIVAKILGGEKPRPRPAAELPAELVALQEQFERSLGTRVHIEKGAKGGKVIIHYFSEEELQAIFEAIVGDSPAR